MAKAFFIGLFVFLACGTHSAQTKPLSEAVRQMSTFANAGSFSVEYDEARYLTVAGLVVDMLVKKKKDPIAKRLKKFEWELMSYFAVKGIEKKPARVVLCVNSRSKRWTFLRNNHMTLVFDGESILLGEPHRSTEYRKGKANERLCWEVDEQIVEEFSAANRVAFSIGTFSGSVPEGKMQLFRDYGKLLSVH